jgi:hypothetical protein
MQKLKQYCGETGKESFVIRENWGDGVIVFGMGNYGTNLFNDHTASGLTITENPAWIRRVE